MKNTSVILAIIVSGMFAITAVGCIIVSVTVADNDTVIARVGLLTAFFTTGAGFVAVLLNQKGMQGAVEGIAENAEQAAANSHAIRNGEMQAKVRSALEDVLGEHLGESADKTTAND